MLDIDGFYFKGYKSFNGVDGIKIDQIKNINLIIGKNNSGKSSFIDVINYIFNNKTYKDNSRRIDSIIIKKIFSYEELSNAYNGEIPQDLNQLINKITPIKIGHTLGSDLVKKYYNGIFASFNYPIEIESLINVTLDSISILKGYNFRRLASERDIVPEVIQDDGNSLDENGRGASDLIGKYITVSTKDEKIIEVELLNELNKILFPDAKFSRIYIQETRTNSKHWEVYLEEESGRGRFSLSQSGSGLKTIILILLNIITLPNILNNSLDKFIFAFEEIENNLHPALQRRIFDYLYKFAVKNDTHIFITTHSHVAINTYSNKEEAQIIHVIKENDTSKIKAIDNHVDKIKILDDLDVRASDIFQSNGIIWVEGPTDRIYVKKWIELFSGSKYKEGNHYHFLYYGGKLLSHYEANSETNEVNELINIMNINRNAVMIIDSDKDNEQANIRDTKLRIKSECIKMDIQCWITAGKEIENYLPKESINNSFNNVNLEQCGQFELFPDYIDSVDKNFSDHKVKFANKIVDNIKKEASEVILDLKEQIDTIIDNIKKWNPEL